jgi:excisionase family DNA binding protein
MSEQHNTKSRFLTTGQVCGELGISEETLMRWVKAGRFPAPLRLGLRRHVWLRVELEEFIQLKIEERNNANSGTN